MQWRAKFPRRLAPAETKELYSPLFELCGYRWYIFRVLACVRTRLTSAFAYWCLHTKKCRKLFLRLKGVADHEEKISLFLQSTDKQPAEPVELWLADHAAVGTTVSRGKLPCSRAVLLQILTVLIACRVLHNLQLIRL